MTTGQTVRGFALVEALVSLAIVTAGVLALLALAQHVTTTVARSRRHLTAAVLADDYVARRLDAAFAATAPDCLQRDRPGCVEPIDDIGRIAATTPTYHRRWRITALAGAPRPAWALSVCVVPIADRHVGLAAPGACVSRVIAEAAP